MNWVKCKILPWGFSGECIFEISTPEEDPIVGFSNTNFLRDSDGNPVEEDKVQGGIEGLVNYSHVTGGSAITMVILPGGLVTEVPNDLLVKHD